MNEPVKRQPLEDDPQNKWKFQGLKQKSSNEDKLEFYMYLVYTVILIRWPLLFQSWKFFIPSMEYNLQVICSLVE